jgi:hypothetical protein
MNLSKQQVKALLEVISKDDTRPALQQAVVGKYNDATFLAATDSYHLVALELKELDGDKFDGQAISRDALTRWYKLAATRDTFTEETLRDELKPAGYDFPKWQSLFTEEKLKLTSQPSVSVQGDYLNDLAKIAGKNVVYDFCKGGMMYADITDNKFGVNDGIYVVMQLKHEGMK